MFNLNFFMITGLGLCIGSFLNVVIYRLPAMLQSEGEGPSHDFFNLAIPRSHCPLCKHTISGFNNIPIISYCFLKGKCAHCKQKISVRYPLVEIVSALLSGYLAIHFGMGWPLVAALIFTWALLCLMMIDFDLQLLPDDITLPLLWLGLITSLFGLFANSHDAIIGAIVGYLSLWSVMNLFYYATGKIGMGHGDFKLSAALGAWMGWQMLPSIIFTASCLAALVGVGLIIFKGYGRDTPIPFGPYLAFSGWITLIGGQPFIHLF